MTPTQRVEQLWSDPGHEGGRQVFLDLARELAAELERAQAEWMEQARLLGKSGSREAALLADLEAYKRDLEVVTACHKGAEDDLAVAKAQLHALRLVCGTTDADKFRTRLDAEIERRKELEAKYEALCAARCTNLMERDAARAECMTGLDNRNGHLRDRAREAIREAMGA